jgi:hypothetical protein
LSEPGIDSYVGTARINSVESRKLNTPFERNKSITFDCSQFSKQPMLLWYHQQLGLQVLWRCRLMATHRAYRSFGPVILIAAGLVLILGVAILVLFPGLIGAAPETPAAPPANIPFSDVPRISLADSYAAWVTGSAVFVDVRGESFYETAHIPGALSIPEEDISERLDQLDKDDWIITYCT